MRGRGGRSCRGGGWEGGGGGKLGCCMYIEIIY